VVLKVSTPQYP